jgi:hypothetical protein
MHGLFWKKDRIISYCIGGRKEFTVFKASSPFPLSISLNPMERKRLTRDKGET